MRTWHIALFLLVVFSYLTYSGYSAAAASAKGRPLKATRPGDTMLFSASEKVGTTGVLGIGGVLIVACGIWCAAARSRAIMTKG